MRISLIKMASILDTSVNTIIKIKYSLGYEKGSAITDDMIPDFRARRILLRSQRKNINTSYPEYYKEAMEIIEANGYITLSKLVSIFKANHVANALSYFETMDNPLYDDKIEATPEQKKKSRDNKKQSNIFRPCSQMVDMWKEESKQNIIKTRFVERGEMKNLRMAIV